MLHSLGAQPSESYLIDKDNIPYVFLTHSNLSIPILDVTNNIILLFPQRLPLDNLIKLLGQFQNEISFNNDPSNRTYIWTKNGSYFIVSLRNKIDLLQVYIRRNAPYTINGHNPLPWTLSYMEEHFGKSRKPYGDENLKLIPYLKEDIPFTRFDYEVSNDVITGFQIYGKWVDDQEKKRANLKILE